MTRWYVDMTRDERVIALYVPWLVDICDVTRWCVWRDSLMCVTWLVHIWRAWLSGWVTWWVWDCLVCTMTRCYAWRDSLMCEIWLDMTRPYVGHDSLLCVPWLVAMCAMTRCYVCHDSLMCNMTACLVNMVIWLVLRCGLDSWYVKPRGGGLGSRPKKMYGKRLEDGVENHLMSPTPRR